MQTVLELSRKAQSRWGRLSTVERAAFAGRLRGRLAEQPERAAEAAVSAQHPQGEVLAAEVLPLLEALRFLEMEAPSLLETRELPGSPFWMGRVQSEVRREPFGVVGVISPGNYPLFLGTVQVAQALVAGNSVVWKPAPGGGPAARLFAQCAAECGLPEGVLTVLSETVEAGVELVESRPDKVIFTGSFQTGTRVLESLARSAIPAVVELSGSDAMIVREDADVERAAQAVVFGLLLNGGRTCIAPRRIFAVGRAAGALEKALGRMLAALSVEVASAEQCARLSPLLLEAQAGGARFLSGGLRGEGRVQLPCVIWGASLDMAILREDLFLPVATVVPVADDVAALAAVGGSPFALGASVFSRDIGAARNLAAAIRAGSVLINDVIVPTADPRVPFGGTGHSGYGLTRGAEGLLELTRVKVVQVQRGAVPHLSGAPVPAALAGALIRVRHAPGWGARLGGIFSLVREGFRQWRLPQSKNRETNYENN